MDMYETVNRQTQGDQSLYDSVRHQSHDYENVAAVVAVAEQREA